MFLSALLTLLIFAIPSLLNSNNLFFEKIYGYVYEKQKYILIIFITYIQSILINDFIFYSKIKINNLDFIEVIAYSDPPDKNYTPMSRTQKYTTSLISLLCFYGICLFF